MRRLLPTILALLLALGAVEGLAWWWMHPAPAGQGEPVLVYRPSRSAGVSPAAQKPEIGDSGSKIGDGSVPANSPDQQSKIINHQSEISSSSTITPLPDIYDKAAPMLRCSSGQVFLARPTDSLSLHLAFFEWDGTDTGSVLEAFRHMPEACMGSIGMILVEKAPARTYAVRGRETGDASRSESLKVESQKSDSKTTRRLFSSDLQPSDLQTFRPSTLPLQRHSSSTTSVVAYCEPVGTDL